MGKCRESAAVLSWLFSAQCIKIRAPLLQVSCCVLSSMLPVHMHVTRESHARTRDTSIRLTSCCAHMRGSLAIAWQQSCTRVMHIAMMETAGLLAPLNIQWCECVSHASRPLHCVPWPACMPRVSSACLGAQLSVHTPRCIPCACTM